VQRLFHEIIRQIDRTPTVRRECSETSLTRLEFENYTLLFVPKL
jgi:hypothetical protein